MGHANLVHIPLDAVASLIRLVNNQVAKLLCYPSDAKQLEMMVFRLIISKKPSPRRCIKLHGSRNLDLVKASQIPCLRQEHQTGNALEKWRTVSQCRRDTYYSHSSLSLKNRGKDSLD